MRNFLKNPVALILLLVMAIHATRGGSFGDPGAWLFNLIMRVPGILIGMSIHEFAHAKAADMLGDPTPRAQGRVTLNPFKHFDPIGLLALVLVGFGWGRPVMISPNRFRNLRRDSFIVSVAGVAVNLVAAFLFCGLIAFMLRFGALAALPSAFAANLYRILYGIAQINLVLMIFNLLPVPPLDGFNALTEIFNLRRYEFWYKFYNMGFPILMVLIMLGVTSRVMYPILTVTETLLLSFWEGVARAL